MSSAPSTTSYLGIMAKAAQAAANDNYKYSPAYYVYALTGHTQAYWGVAQMIANFGGDATKLVDAWPVPKEYPASNASNATLSQGQAYYSNSTQAQGYLAENWTDQLHQNTLLFDLAQFCLEPASGYTASSYFTPQEQQWMGQIQHYYANGASYIYIPPWPPSDATALTQQQLIAHATTASSATATSSAVSAPSVSSSAQAGNPTHVITHLPPAHPMGRTGISTPVLLGLALLGYFMLKKG